MSSVDTMAPDAGVRGAVTSRDGTSIGYQRIGRGPALVICHGSYSVADDWRPVAALLATERTVFIYDRRGRGASDDQGKPYAFEAEVDDLAAVMSVAGPQAALVGHSFGGACAMMYVVRDGIGGRLVLYEPAHSLAGPLSGGRLPAFRARLDANDPDGATVYALEHLAGVPAGDVPGLRASAVWPFLVGLSPTFYRETEALDRVAPTVKELEALQARTWLLLGETTVTDPCMRCAAALVERIRGLTLYPIAGQGHVAHRTDPGRLAHLVLRCLRED